MDGDAPRAAYYGIYFSLFVLLQRILKPVTFRIEIEKKLTAKLLKLRYLYPKLCIFSKSF